jgi:hypothetical protein
MTNYLSRTQYCVHPSAEKPMNPRTFNLFPLSSTASLSLKDLMTPPQTSRLTPTFWGHVPRFPQVSTYLFAFALY